MTENDQNTTETTESLPEGLDPQTGPDPQTDPVEPVESLTEAPEGVSDDDQDDVFPREYVEKLRKESQGLRDRLRDAEAATASKDEELEQVRRLLHKALVERDGRLVDADALEYNQDHLSDPEVLTAAVDELLAAKPYLSSKRFQGTVHQGAEPVSSAVSMTALLRGGRA